MVRRSIGLGGWCRSALLSGLVGGCIFGATESAVDGAAPAATYRKNVDRLTTSEDGGNPLRELSTDRPDATESPFTVNAGHLQIEADFASHLRTNSVDERVRERSVGTTNIRVGIADNLELGVFVSPWIRQVVDSRGGPPSREVHSGFGDITLRGKINFLGNDGGPFALGLITDVTFATAARDLGVDRTSGLVLLPWTIELPGKWTLGSMTGAEWRRSASDDSLVWINSASFGHDITESVGGYLELTSEAGDGPHIATFDAGLTFQINPNFQLDCGVNLGISQAADDLVVFAGFARRF